MGSGDSIQSLEGSDAVPEAEVAARIEFAQIYKVHFDYVAATVRRLGVPAADHEDLIHDIFMVLHQNIANYDSARPLKPWLFGIAFRVVSTYRRAGRHRFEVKSETFDPTSTATSPEQLAQASESHALVLRALESLSLEQRAVFVMHVLDGYAIPDLVEPLETPLNTLYSRLRVARAIFAEKIERLLGSEER